MPFKIYQNAPIAIYDSGVGGLTIAKAIQTLLPEESIHYIGDTQNLPYGDKTLAELCGYVKQVVDFCLNKQYKLLVIACNTAAAAAEHFLSFYLKKIDAKINIINVIDPVIAHIKTTNLYKAVGVIATNYTVKDGIYEARLQAAGIKVSTLATPLLVPMVEDYFNGRQIDDLLLNHYLNQIMCPALDSLIPACTHYLFLETALKNFLRKGSQKNIEVIDVAGLTGLAVKRLLTASNLLNDGDKITADCFMATSLTQPFKKATQQLFGAIPMPITLINYGKSLDYRLHL